MRKPLASPFIYVACPWGPSGGGMFKVADYLIQAQAAKTPVGAAELRPLDTRGASSAVYSLWVVLGAVAKLVRGRLSGQLVGVHVNVAERLSLFRESLVVVACSVLGVPVVLHLHAAQLHHFYRTLPAFLQAATRWVFSLPAQCIVLGHASQQFVVEELKVPADRVQIVINGVPGATVPRRSPVSAALQRVLFLGNLSERKGVADLLKALAQADFDGSRLQVSIAGGGDVAGYEAIAQRLGLDGFVRFEGWADQAKAAQLLAQADVLVLPSYDEGLPLVILEALAHGVAVLCTPVGEIPLELTDGVNACFVQPGDIEGIARGLQKLLSEPGLREALERNGRAAYEQKYSLAKFFSSVTNIHRTHFGIAAAAGSLGGSAP